MKRKLFWIIPLSVVTLSSCSLFNMFNGGGGTEESKDEFEALNTALNVNYNEFKVEVKTKKDDLELNSSYFIKKQGNGYLTEYKTQEYATFDLATNTISENMIETKEGSYVTNNKEFNIKNFVVKKDTFTNFKLTQSEFEANLNNAKTYLNASYNCNNFKINIKFNSKLQSISLSYLLDNNTQCNINYFEFK